MRCHPLKGCDSKGKKGLRRIIRQGWGMENENERNGEMGTRISYSPCETRLTQYQPFQIDLLEEEGMKPTRVIIPWCGSQSETN